VKGRIMESAIRPLEEVQIRLLRQAEADTFSGVTARRLVMTVGLILSDSAALLLSGWGAVKIRAIMGEFPVLRSLSLSPYFNQDHYPRLIPLLLLFHLMYASRRLYPTIGLNRVDELRLLTISTTLVATLYATILFLFQQGLAYSRVVFALFWMLSLLLVPTARVLGRKILVRLSLWGVPAGIVGGGQRTDWAVNFLASHRNLGLRPVIVFDGNSQADREIANAGRVDFAFLDHPCSKLLLKRLDTLIVVQAETSTKVLSYLVSEVNHSLPRIMIMPDLPQVGSIWVRPVDLGGVLGLKIRNNLASHWQRFLKRSLDLALGLLLALAALPLLLLIAAAIELDSRGPIFYGQKRIGYNGRPFTCWKFRTMVCGAEESLQTYLKLHPSARVEWESAHKLKGDPRITWGGKLLRKLSLDELPQLWNVLKGDMSLVGPRPIIPAEFCHYEEAFALYSSVRPGITGLWQVSGRNDVGYQTRVSLDSYYVRNWSVWLDLYILARTPIAVISHQGAY
jgi:Undecaprenyl-phosphate galactose phosphotransferase WbaP